MEKTSQKFVKNRIFIVILLLVMLMFLEGCGGKKEVEQLGFVMGIGIDKGEKPETYNITTQIALPKSSGGSGTEMENWTISTEVSTLGGSAENMGRVLNRIPFGGTTRVVVLGEDLARAGINEALDSFQRFYQFRRTIYLVLAKGKAKDILETQLRTKQLPALNLLGTIKGQTTFSSFPVTRMGHYLTILGRESQNPVIPTVQSTSLGTQKIEYSKEKGEELLLEGAGVFEDGKLIDFLTDEETKGFIWLDNSMKSRYFLAKGENNLVLSAWIHKTSTKFKIQPDEEGKVGITFQIKTKASLREIKGQQGAMDINGWNEYTKTLEPIIAQAIEKECRAAVEKSRKLHADFIGIGRKLEQKDPKYWKQVKDDWLNQLSDFPVSYDIQVIIENTGLPQYSPISPQKSGQE